MREFMDLLGMPLSDSIRNPMSDTGGQIDADIRRISDMLTASGHDKLAKEVRGLLNAALHNPGEYAFSNVLNCVKMTVVAQTLLRLRRECEAADRPFDPIREMRRFSSYVNAEIGGIQPERYAWLTPGTQQVLRLAMFSYSWTMGAWTAGTGEVVTDLIFGGHHTNRDTRRFAFIRWLRMLGIVKVGVPVVLQACIRGLAGAIQKLGWVGVPDDPDDKDPLGIEDMPWLCFDNESKIGALSFDITPLLRLCGRLRRGAVSGLPDGVVSALPTISSAVGGVVGSALTRSVGGGLIGSAVGGAAGSLVPNHTGVGHGRNTSGNRRYYMHFGKQSDEFWRWFTDPWSQATNKLSIPTQKAVEAFFGSTNGSNFGKNFADKPLLDRFLTTDLDPQENAIVNLFTAFLPFSAASMASNPDAGALGMFAPVQMGASMTGQQKKIAARLEKIARDDRPGDVWAESRNHRELRLLAADILRECRMNGFQPDEVLNSGLGTAAGNLYKALYSALPKTKDDSVNGREVAEILRAMRRINVKKTGLETSLRNKYKNANIDLEKPRNAAAAKALRRIMRETGRDPWLGDEAMDELLNAMFDNSAYQQLRSVDVQQDRKGGEAFSNFLATDEVPETLFGIPVVSQDYTEEDLEFFKRNPKAAGFYDLGDEEEPEPPPDGGGGGGSPVMDLFGGDAGAYQEAFAQKRKDLVNNTAERQYKALLKFKDPDHRRRVEAYLYAALDSDARNAALLDEYNRLAEANRPSSRRGRASYDEMIERGRGRFAGGAWEKALGELVSPDWIPPAEAPAAQPRQGRSFMSRAKEALDVAKDLPGLIAGGAERLAADVKETIGAAGAVLYAPNAPGVEMYDPASRAIRDGKTGQVKRTASDRDRAAIREVDEAIGIRQDAKGGEARGAYPGSLNNPGNVEKRRERRQGEVESPHRRWAKFATPQDGLREMADAMRQIADVKLAGAGKDFTIRNFAEVYAPRKNKKGEKENDTDQYIRDISSDSGLDADTPLVRDADGMAKLLRSVVRFESGYPHSQWFTDEEYREAAGKLKK
jgi:hypothetical protein